MAYRQIVDLRFGAGSPVNRISPESGPSSPVSKRTSVDLPAPFRPTRATDFPADTRKRTLQIFHSICCVGGERLGDRGVEDAGAYQAEHLRARVDADVADMAGLAYLSVAPRRAAPASARSGLATRHSRIVGRLLQVRICRQHGLKSRGLLRCIPVGRPLDELNLWMLFCHAIVESLASLSAIDRGKRALQR
jgi:hypothetical protein